MSGGAAPGWTADQPGAEAEDLGNPNVNDSGQKYKKKTFKSVALDLWDKGYNPIPCRHKIPAVKDWNPGAASREQVEAWAKLFPDCNVGIVNTPALDVDCYHAIVVAVFLKILKYCYGLTMTRTGQAPKTLLPFLCRELKQKILSRTFIDPANPGVEHRLEVSAPHKHQWIGYGEHPVTKGQYVWDGGSPRTVHRKGLAELTLDQVHEIVKTFEELCIRHGLVPKGGKREEGEPGGEQSRGAGAPHHERTAGTETIIDNYNLNGHDHFRDSLLDGGWPPAGEGVMPFTDQETGQHFPKIKTERFTRPGKEEGVSADLYKHPVKHQWRFHVFSTSVEGLDAGSYQIGYAYVRLFHGGDYGAAIAALKEAGFKGEDDFADLGGGTEGDQAGGGQPGRKREFRFLPECEVLKGSGRLDWLVEALVAVGTLTTVIGPPRTLKTFLAIGIGVAVASGRPWFGHAVQQGPVAFLIGEGHHGFGNRLLATRLGFEIPPDESLPIYVSTAPLAIPDKNQVTKLETALREIEAKHGRPPALLVVDTLARNFGGADENSTSDMGGFVNNLVGAVDPATAVIVIHHTGWSDPSRARGASNLFGGVDGEFILARKGTRLEVTCRKLKDSPEWERPMPFEAKTVIVGADEEGPIEGLFLESTEPTEAEPTLSEAMTKAVDILVSLSTDDSGVALEDWCKACLEQGAYGSEKAFKRAVRKLEARRIIWNRGGRFQARKSRSHCGTSAEGQAT